ncbi:MAG: HIT domain-containing protein [Isosphaeraceae bacterium]|nr:HIT domain-containing protein [Isosphaeraceae bacterium]
MDRIWAPWRAQYILASAGKPAPVDSCFICAAERSDRSSDRENLLVHRGEQALVLLNRYPYNNGHLLVAPRVHKASPGDCTIEEWTAPLALVKSLVDVLSGMLGPHGFNVGLNLGRSAGAGLPGHLHWHIVPRWDGDTNFMPVLGDAKVIVESLDAFYDRLIERLSSSPSFTGSP